MYCRRREPTASCGGTDGEVAGAAAGRGGDNSREAQEARAKGRAAKHRVRCAFMTRDSRGPRRVIVGPFEGRGAAAVRAGWEGRDNLPGLRRVPYDRWT